MPVTASQLEHLTGRGDPVVTAVVCAPPASEDSDDRRRLRAAELRSQIGASAAPEPLLDRVEGILSRGASTGWEPGDWRGVVADPDRVDVVPMVDGRHDLLSVGSLPRFVPFVRDAFEHRPHLVVRADRVGASIARVTRGRIRSDTDVEGDEQHVQKVSSGGFSQRRMQAHSEHTWDQNAQEIVETLVEEADAISAELIVVTGDERAVELVRGHLPERWKDALTVDDLQPADESDEAYVFERASTLVRDQAASEVVDLLERFAEARGREEAADGTEAVFDALRVGSVEVLLVAEDVDDEVHFAVEDPRQIARDPSVLTAMGFEQTRAGRLTDVAIQAALSGDSGVVICPAHGPNSPDGGLGALLRF